MPKIVLLDGQVANPNDLSWDSISMQGDLAIYPRTTDEQLLERAKDATVLIVNKRTLNADTLKQLPHLKLICTLATGYNNINVAAAKALNITVCNAVGYSSPSVAQQLEYILPTVLTNSSDIPL